MAKEQAALDRVKKYLSEKNLDALTDVIAQNRAILSKEWSPINMNAQEIQWKPSAATSAVKLTLLQAIIAKFGTLDAFKKVVEAMGYTDNSYINIRSSRGYTLLAVAAWFGREEIMQFLFDHGAEVNISTVSPIYHAAKNGHEAIVRILLERGDDPAGIDIFDAIKQDYTNIVKMAVEKKPDIVRQKNHEKKETPLHVVVLDWNLEIARALLAAGADVNAKDDFGKTPLVIAVESNKPAMVKLLLENGANPEVSILYNSSSSGRLVKTSLYEYARISGFTDIASILSQYIKEPIVQATPTSVSVQPQVSASMQGQYLVPTVPADLFSALQQQLAEQAELIQAQETQLAEQAELIQAQETQLRQARRTAQIAYMEQTEVIQAQAGMIELLYQERVAAQSLRQIASPDSRITGAKRKAETHTSRVLEERGTNSFRGFYR